MDEDLPLDELYSKGLPIGDMLFEEMDYSNNLWDNVDWDRSVDVPDDVLEATTYIATHSHYLKTAHLLLCGKVIQHETENASFDTTQIAMILTAYKLESIHVWGRYLGTVKQSHEISRAMKLYLRKLFSEDNTFSVLIGMEILSGPLMQTIYASLQSKGDELYTTIVSNLNDRRDREKDMLRKQLAPAIKQLPRSTKNKLKSDARQYQNLAENVLLDDSDLYAAVDLDVDDLHDKIDRDTTTFLSDIGLDMRTR